jgi:outer membrane protein assembly factor BamB
MLITHRRMCVALLLMLLPRGHADDWPQFRGPQRDNIAREKGLLRAFPEAGPQVLWSIDVCQGYAGAAVVDGRVYIQDYDRDQNAWLVRCLQLSDGKELWRFTAEKRIRPNHGITRTVPAVTDKYVFALDPKCDFHCIDAKTGVERWQKSLVKDYGAKIPPWYNGQCPLLDDDRVVIGVGGRDALMVAFDTASGEELWRTPNPEQWPLAHASVMSATIGGERQYLWCTLFGPLGVAADDGRLLWHHARTFNLAIAPSPLFIPDNRVFQTSGYDGGIVLLQIIRAGERFATDPVFDRPGDAPDLWNSEVHTPILHENHLFAVGKEKRGLFSCVDLDGKVVWDSADQASFGLGSFLLADGMFFVLEGKTGMLRLIDANTKAYREIAHAQVLSGHDVWAPMALSQGRLILRDMQRMVCIQVAEKLPEIETARVDRPHGAAPVMQLASLGDPPGDTPTTARYHAGDTITDCAGDGADRIHEALRGVAVDADDNLYVVGDQLVIVYDRSGKRLRRWPTERPAGCVTIDADQRVWVGEPGQIEIFAMTGARVDAWRDDERFGYVTSIAFGADRIYVADVGGRAIRCFDAQRKFLRNIDRDEKNRRGFMLPNRHLDLAVDGAGHLLANNPGQHRVLFYDPDGAPLRHIGQFHPRDPAGFTGCCNPTCIALTPVGLLVTAEKAPPRIKLLDPSGKLVTVIATEGFDPACKNMDVAVDSRGRIYVIDTEQLHVRVFEPGTAPAKAEDAA